MAEQRSSGDHFPSLGPLERRVLEVLWAATGPLTPADVLAAVPADAAYAYTTILTILVRLTKKGLAQRERAGRAYAYSARLSREEFLSQASRALVREFSDEFGPAAVMHFADAVANLPRKERQAMRDRLRELFDE